MCNKPFSLHSLLIKMIKSSLTIALLFPLSVNYGIKIIKNVTARLERCFEVRSPIFFFYMLHFFCFYIFFLIEW